MSLDPHTRNGLMYANKNENHKSAFDSYTSDVMTANTVLIIRNIRQVHSVRIHQSTSQIRYLHDSITK